MTCHKTDLSHRDLASVWHPCTQMHDHPKVPMIAITRGQGIWLYDDHGHRYLDAVSSWWTNLFGHAEPHIANAIKDQLEQLEHVIFAGFTHQPAVELAERLIQLTPPGLERVFFADNGSSAVEVALKMSYHYWRNCGYRDKTRFVTLSGSYHGETLGALSVSDVALYRSTYAPLLLTPVIVPSPDAYQRETGESWQAFAQRRLGDMRKVFEQQADSLCAVIIEPLVQCAGGMRMYHPSYLHGLRQLCDEFHVHLIADEIAVGFGRTGTLFACEQAPIRPDFMLLSKGLTGGFLPLSAVLTTAEIYAAFYAEYSQNKAFLHSHSYTGNPLACRAALATLDLFRDRPVLEQNRELSTHLGCMLESLAEHPHVAEVRQTGMIAAVELVQDKVSRTPFPAVQRRGLDVYLYCLKHGVLQRPLGDIIYFMPPYCITPEEIGVMVRTAIEGINQATSR